METTPARAVPARPPRKTLRELAAAREPAREAASNVSFNSSI